MTVRAKEWGRHRLCQGLRRPSRSEKSRVERENTVPRPRSFRPRSSGACRNRIEPEQSPPMTAATPTLVLERASRHLAGRAVVCGLDLTLTRAEQSQHLAAGQG